MSNQSSELINTYETSKQIAHLINYSRFNKFPEQLAEFISIYCCYDDITILTKTSNNQPSIILPNKEITITPALKNYIKKEYSMDPSLNPCITEGKTIFRFIDLLTDLVSKSDFYNTYYKSLGYSDEVLMCFQINPNTRIIISLGRKENLGSVRRQELQRLHQLYPVINAVIQQFWLHHGDRYLQETIDVSALESALKTFGNGVLTQREKEISSLIIQGYSSKCIAEDLSISLGTVKVHRKNIHSRMKISGQSDLFKEFLSHLNHYIFQAA